MNKKTSIIVILTTVILLIGIYFLAVIYFFPNTGETNTRDISTFLSSVETETNFEQEVKESKEQDEIYKVNSNPTTTNSDTEVNADEQPIIFTHAQLSYDPSNTEVLVENKTHIFLARVLDRIENRGVRPDYTWPTFSAEKISTIKGDLPTIITLVQTEIHYSDGRTYVVNGDIAWPADTNESDILFKVGETYLFTAVYTEEKDLYGVGLAPYDRVLISSDPSISAEAAIALAKQNPRVQEILEEVGKQGALNEDWR